MHNSIICLLIFLTITYNSAFASVHGADTEPKKESPAFADKSRLLINELSKINDTHIGGVEAIHLILEQALQMSPNIANKNILDIGCGFGGTANFLQKEGFKQIWGIDIDASAIEYSKQHYPDVQFTVADATKLTAVFEDEFFSFVYMFNVAYAIDDKAAMLQKIKAVCKQGAVLAIFDYALKDPSYADAIIDITGAKIPPLNIDKLKTLLVILGWEVVENTDITEKYKSWYKNLLARIDSQKEMLIASGYSVEEIKLVQDNLLHMLSLMNENKLGGTILFAKKL